MFSLFLKETEERSNQSKFPSFNQGTCESPQFLKKKNGPIY